MLEIESVQSIEHLRQYRQLIEELGAWDRAMVQSLNLDVSDLLELHYPDQVEVDAFPAEFSAPSGCLLLARYGGHTAGCGGLQHLAPTIGETRRLYVRPAFRGQDIARALMDALIACGRQIGYRTLRLNTASFMMEAQSLYHALGFRDIEAYRTPPAAFKAHEVYMELTL